MTKKRKFLPQEINTSIQRDILAADNGDVPLTPDQNDKIVYMQQVRYIPRRLRKGLLYFLNKCIKERIVSKKKVSELEELEEIFN